MQCSLLSCLTVSDTYFYNHFMQIFVTIVNSSFVFAGSYHFFTELVVVLLYLNSVL